MTRSRKETGQGVAVSDKSEIRTRKPRLYKVLLLNDDYTTMDFVVFILQSIFHLENNRAQKVMLAVHEQGSGLAGIYPKDVAETKIFAVHQMARQSGFPLRCNMEPE